MWLYHTWLIAPIAPVIIIDLYLLKYLLFINLLSYKIFNIISFNL